ncbi:hypothetical protein M5K25_009404 [Dendrobium thyrsiflorum]|uniref:Uncharacterized protein n=1 Tax=Dendrobium thyrsiflorum TaxID=117978 RepID=A0ABD0V6D7_DENTH
MREAADSCDSIRRRTNAPIPSASKMFAILFLASGFLLARRMREKLRSSAPLLDLSSDEIAAAVCVLASLAFHLPRLLRRS